MIVVGNKAVPLPAEASTVEVDGREIRAAGVTATAVLLMCRAGKSKGVTLAAATSLDLKGAVVALNTVLLGAATGELGLTEAAFVVVLVEWAKGLRELIEGYRAWAGFDAGVNGVAVAVMVAGTEGAVIIVMVEGSGMVAACMA